MSIAARRHVRLPTPTDHHRPSRPPHRADWAAHHTGRPDQREAARVTAARNRWFFTGPARPGEPGVRIRDDGRHLVYNGRHPAVAGSRVADVTVLVGALEGPGTRLLAVVPGQHPGLTFHDDTDDHADTEGARSPYGNNVCIAEVRVARADVRAPTG